MAMGNLKQIQGPVWHLPADVYATGLTGVPFFISCLKDLAVNLSSGFGYIAPSDISEFVHVKHETGFFFFLPFENTQMPNSCNKLL